MNRQVSPPALKPSEASVYQDEDMFSKAGVRLPSHLQTRSQRWGTLLVIAVTGACASGPLASWPTLEPLLISDGVWAGDHQLEKLQSVQSIAWGIGMISFFLSGVFYDALGARALGCGGAFGVALCLLAMALAVKIPQLNNLLWVAYPAAAALGGANSFDVYAWLWLLPENQSMVAALAGAIQCLADSFCLLAVFLHDSYGLELDVYFMITCCMATVAGVLAWLLVPAHDEMRRISNSCVQILAGEAPDVDAAAAITDYGAVGEASNVLEEGHGETAAIDSGFSDAMSKAWTSLGDTYVLVTRVCPGAFSLFLAYMMFMYMFCMYPMIEMYSLYIALVGEEQAVLLVNIFGGLFAFLGAALILVYGIMMDILGMEYLMIFGCFVFLLTAYLYSIPSVFAQVCAQVFLTGISNMWYVTVPRFSTAYGPPELFGTLGGIMAVVLGVGQISLNPMGTKVGTAISNMLQRTGAHHNAALPYLVTIDLWCLLGELSSVALLVWWWYRPLPAPGTTTMDHVRKAAYETDTSVEELI